jgi:hypothetical protein
MIEGIMYTKNQTLGKRADGEYPTDGKVKPVHKGVKEPLAHVGPIYESEPQHANNIARSGAPKKLDDVEVHSGMHARNRDGTLITGMDVGRAPPDPSSSNPLDPGPSNKSAAMMAVAKPVVGHRSRTQAGEVTPMAPGVAYGVSEAAGKMLHDARHENAAAVIGQAAKSGGKAIV